MHSLTPDYLAKLRFDTQQLATLRALGEYRGKQLLYVVGRDMVRLVLRTMKAEGLIAPTGKGQGARGAGPSGSAWQAACHIL